MAMGTRSSGRSKKICGSRIRIWLGSGASVLSAFERVAGGERLRRVCRGAVREVLCGEVRASSLTPGIYFRALLIGYFEGIERSAASLGGWRTRWRCGVCGHRAGRVHAGSLDDFAHPATDRSGHASGSVRLGAGVLADRGLLKGQRIAIDATTWRPTRRCARLCGATRARAMRIF